MTNFIFSVPKFESLRFHIGLQTQEPDLVGSKLYNDDTFYKQLTKDLRKSRQEVIIESPFITSTRMYHLISLFRELVNRKVKCYVITRNPVDHDLTMRQQAEEETRKLQTLGVQVILTNEYSHRKLAIIDRKILWEGSLNILSQTYSKEFMRRIESKTQAQECFDFVRFGTVIY